MIHDGNTCKLTLATVEIRFRSERKCEEAYRFWQGRDSDETCGAGGSTSANFACNETRKVLKWRTTIEIINTLGPVSGPQLEFSFDRRSQFAFSRLMN